MPRVVLFPLTSVASRRGSFGLIRHARAIVPKTIDRQNPARMPSLVACKHHIPAGIYRGEHMIVPLPGKPPRSVGLECSK